LLVHAQESVVVRAAKVSSSFRFLGS